MTTLATKFKLRARCANPRALRSEVTGIYTYDTSSLDWFREHGGRPGSASHTVVFLLVVGWGDPVRAGEVANSITDATICSPSEPITHFQRRKSRGRP